MLGPLHVKHVGSHATQTPASKKKPLLQAEQLLFVGPVHVRQLESQGVQIPPPSTKKLSTDGHIQILFPD